MDEISISDITYAARLDASGIKEFIIDPLEYGIKRAPLEAIIGGDAKFNAQILHDIFNNKAQQAQKDIVLINAAASLMVEGMARDIQDGIEIANETLLSGKAKAKLEQIMKVSSLL
jgi:anthranilate phosphoribosyltransferase